MIRNDVLHNVLVVISVERPFSMCIYIYVYVILCKYVYIYIQIQHLSQ